MTKKLTRTSKIIGAAVGLTGLITLGFQNCSQMAANPGGLSQASQSPPGPEVPVVPVPTLGPQYFGRFEFASGPDYFGKTYDAGRDQARFSWSGSAIRANFFGTQVTVAFRSVRTKPDRPIWFSVQVDDRDAERFAIEPEATYYPVAINLPQGPHRVTIMRESEGAYGLSEFLGFDFGANGTYIHELPTSPSLRLEVIGDSITCGYDSLTENCADWADKQSAYHSFGQIAARALAGGPNGRPATQICHSGMGVTRALNMTNGNGQQMPWAYEFTRTPAAGGITPWFFPTAAAEQPNYVVVNLGTNDFWSGEPTSFRADLKAFITSIRTRYPSAFILVGVGPMTAAPYGAVAATVTDLQKTDARVSLLMFPRLTAAADLGCDGVHPSRAAHQRMADQLVREINGIEMVRRVYVELIGREPTAEAYERYRYLLRNGRTEGELIEAITLSEEYQALAK